MSISIHAGCDQTVAAARSGQSKGSGAVLATCILASGLAFVDGSVVNVGLPAIRASLQADASNLQWVINAYLLPLSALILLGGAAGDRFGRKRLLIAGIALFALASLGCAAAPNVTLLLVSRLAQGAGAAILMPNSLAILGATFEGQAKGRAIGTWAAMGAALGAVGPMLGGWLIDTVGWRAIFLINLPIAVGAILLAWRYVPADGGKGSSALDRRGAALATIGLGTLTYGLTIGSGRGWTPLAICAIVAASMLLSLFVIVERRRGERAMVPLSLFGSSNFVGLSLLTLLLYGALGVLFVLIPYLLIAHAGFSAAQAGAGLLPLPVVIALASPLMGSLSARMGSRLPLSLGPLVVAGGFVLALRIGGDTDYWSGLFPALLVIAAGMSLAVAPLTTAVLGAVDKAHAGSASGFNSALARTGGLIGTALLGSVIGAKGPALITGFRLAMAGCATASVAASVAVILMYRDSDRSGGTTRNQRQWRPALDKHNEYTSPFALL
jgi:EmrB/QacA subfamily drug resistance transporter